MPVQPRLEMPGDLSSVYANLVRIAHSPSELVFDFAQLLPGNMKAPVQARVLMSPLSAKLLQRALAENIAKYEATFGPINIPKKQASLADYLFQQAQNPGAKADEGKKEDEASEDKGNDDEAEDKTVEDTGEESPEEDAS
ncbi:MAG: DUF3467 domain-containing protein [Chloroflexi bacterium]|nr:MAG: DUF3467 domain-containing protein [Chloroflexota bacterium]MBL1196276.1 DUF3467 domain-containing protein [Chloroflexota bacterium]NOH13571.1 DUF3467 domain-containing protein [Chloroflexota bacterium]